MKKLLLFLLLLSNFVFIAKSQIALTSNFAEEIHNYKIDTGIIVTVLYHGNFYSLREDKDVFTVNGKTGAINNNYDDGSKSLNLENLIVKKDTLFGFGRYDSYYLNSNGRWSFLRKETKEANFYFEDENYFITSTCSGEFGGSLYFKNKKDKKLYECAATCPINIIKQSKKYYVTASLSHMRGFANIFAVDEPGKLKQYDRKGLEKKIEKAERNKTHYVGFSGENESHSKKGVVNLVDTVGITIAASFIYKGTIYYITEKYNSVSIDTLRKLEVKRSRKKAREIEFELTPVQDLSSYKIWGDDSYFRINDEQEIFSFDNPGKTGFVQIKNNKLTFYLFDKVKK